MKRTIVVIPARSGSKSMKDKNLQLVQGHSLLGWAVRIALLGLPKNSVYVDTDSPAYAEEAQKYGAQVPFLREKALALDSTSDFESFASLVSKLGLASNTLVVHLRPTTPLRVPAEVTNAVRIFNTLRNQATSLRSVHEMSETAYKTFERTTTGMLSPLSALVNSLETANLPRQSFPATFVANGYVDVFPAENIETTGTLHGDSIYGYVTPPTLEVDSPHDLEMIRLQASQSEFHNIFDQNQAEGS